MNELLDQLKEALTEEHKLQSLLKENKETKEKILEKLDSLIIADNYSNDFVTLRRKPTIKVRDELLAQEFMKETKILDKKKVEDYWYAKKPTPGIQIDSKLVAYKKKGELGE